MSKLSDFVKSRGMDEIFTMNFLQDEKVISDNCITSEDVADADFEASKKAIVNLLARCSY